MSHKTLIIIAGPTAVGKTALSVQLANHFNCPILSFDSRQFYNEMTIGTAKPNPEELSAAEHHFIGNLSIHERYTAGMFERDALAKLAEIYTTHSVCIAVGGSGLYIDALAFGIDDIPANDEIRVHFHKRWADEGLDQLKAELQEIDPDYYAIADLMNPRRVIRALEVFKITGRTYTELRKKTAKIRPFNMIWLGLNLPREVLFERINNRVDQMMTNGLLEEVAALLPHQECKALNTVGYSELFSYLNGEIDLERATELIKRNSRQYAKRQLTWFKKNELVNWYNPTDFHKIIEEIPK